MLDRLSTVPRGGLNGRQTPRHRQLSHLSPPVAKDQRWPSYVASKDATFRPKASPADPRLQQPHPIIKPKSEKMPLIDKNLIKTPQNQGREFPSTFEPSSVKHSNDDDDDDDDGRAAAHRRRHRWRWIVQQHHLRPASRVGRRGGIAPAEPGVQEDGPGRKAEGKSRPRNRTQMNN